MPVRTQQIKLLLTAQSPDLPAGIGKFGGALSNYLKELPYISVNFFNETIVKGRTGANSSNIAAEIRDCGRVLKAFNSYICKIRPDVAHINVAHGRSVLEKVVMIWLTSRYRIPALVHMHGAVFYQELETMSASRRRVLGHILTPPNHVVVLSDRIQHLLQQVLPGVRSTIIPTAVTLMAPPPPIIASPIRIGFIGYMEERKGERELVDAMAHTRHKNFHIVYAGDGPNRPKVEQRVAELGLKERVEFLGTVNGASKDAFFRSIDLLALPSYGEGMPAALLEAMAYGRSVIATAVGGVPDMVTDGKDGWLIPSGDIVALACAIDAAVSNVDELRQRGQVAWRRVASRHTWKINGPEYIRIYNTLIEN